MQNNGSWPPPPTNQAPLVVPQPKPRFSPRVLLLAAGLGALIGFVDIHLTTAQESKSWAANMDNYYMAAACLCGILQPKTFWLSAAILTGSFYTVHVIAIMNGLGSPYVEPTIDAASECLFNIIPNGLSALAGAGLGMLWRQVKLKLQKS